MDLRHETVKRLFCLFMLSKVYGKAIMSKDYQWACNKLFYGLGFSSNLICLLPVFMHFTKEQEVEKSENSESDHMITSDDHGTTSA